MRAILFAAGRGERMKPLTERAPKALLEAGGKALIVRQLERLAAAGIRDVVVNVAHLAAIERDADGQYYVRLRDHDERLAVSRRMASELRERFRI